MYQEAERQPCADHEDGHQISRFSLVTDLVAALCEKKHSMLALPPKQRQKQQKKQCTGCMHVGRQPKTHGMAFISLMYSGVALPSCACFNQRALAGTCTVYTVRGVSLVVLPWPVCHQHKLYALLPSSEGRVCCPCCCVHRACSQTGAAPIGCGWAS